MNQESIQAAPMRLDGDEARAALSSALGWPDATELRPEEMEALLLWVPFSPRTTRNLVNPEVHPRLAGLAATTEHSRRSAQIPRPRQGTIIDPCSQDEPVVYYPVWQLSGRKGQRQVELRGSGVSPARLGAIQSFLAQEGGLESWALVDALTGEWAAGKMAANRFQTLGFFAFCAFLVIYGTAGAGYLLTEFNLLSAMALRSGLAPYGPVLGPAIAAMAMLAVVALFAWGLRVWLPQMLLEPTRRAYDRWVGPPKGEAWRGLLTANGIIAILLILNALGGVATHSDSPTSTGFYLLFFLSLAVHLAFAWGCFKLGRTGSLAKTSMLTVEDYPDGGMTCLAWVAMYVIGFSVLGGLIAHALCLAGIIAWFGGPDYEHAKMFWVNGCVVGSVLAIMAAPLVKGTRAPVVAGIIASALSDLYLGPVYGSILVIVAVFLPVVVMDRSHQLLPALRLAWAFVLGETAGRLAGRVLGFFFLGLEGGTIGALLGERVVGIAAFLRVRSSIQRSHQDPDQMP